MVNEEDRTTQPTLTALMERMHGLETRLAGDIGGLDGRIESLDGRIDSLGHREVNAS